MTTASARAQTETLGVVLLLAVTLAGTGLVVAFGSSMLDDSKRAAELDSAEHAMTQLDSKASLVGIGDTDTQRVNLGVENDGRTLARTDGGWMRVEVHPDDGGEVEVMNQTLGAVVYRNGETTVAYQGGGVWKRTGDGATMVSPPEFHYRETTLTLPLVVVGGEGALEPRLEITKNGTAESKFPLAEPEKTNPLSEATVNVTVRSDYYRAWGSFFEQRTGGEVEYDHSAESVTLTLVTPTKAPKIEQGLASTSPSELVIQGSGGSSFTDSYNSSVGPYSETEGTNGTIKTVGGVSLSGGAVIEGDLVTGGGVVKMESANTEIVGNLSYGGSTALHKKATIGGWTADNGSVEQIDPIGSMIENQAASLAADNDNGATEAIDGRSLNATKSTWTLTSGNYYLDDLDIASGETLVLDLNGGDIDLVIDDDVTLSGGKITVQNPDNGTANLYATGRSVSVTNAASVSVSGDESPALRIYAPPGTSATFSGEETRFVGVLYAPDSKSQYGDVSVTSHARVYGAIVGGKTTLKSGGRVHYDQALVTTKTLPAEFTSVPRVTYMHVSVNRVNVTAV
ncbi:DUF7289 family protein [Haladaptatus salinisoli]|uniref:DUF7289 family protein n=1 Tax=Haladaptatus salinisoli TaxID=2884876 RepID=UPI001D09EBCF|nr:hypothetical protein [Haladaptatus salinisoli]